MLGALNILSQQIYDMNKYELKLSLTKGSFLIIFN